jgi:beta-phosphoglucomutase
MFKAVIFDLDGVLVSTDEYHYVAWKRLADEINIPFDKGKNEKLKGIDRANSLLFLLGQNHGYSQDELRELAVRKNKYYIDSLSSLKTSDIYSGAVELINNLKNHQVIVAVASSSKNAEIVLKNVNLFTKIDALITGNDISKAKPSPEIFLKTAERIKTDPNNCIVIEDAQSGIEAANIAGMYSIGLGSVDDFESARTVVDSLTELTYNKLLEITRPHPQTPIFKTIRPQNNVF